MYLCMCEAHRAHIFVYFLFDMHLIILMCLCICAFFWGCLVALMKKADRENEMRLSDNQQLSLRVHELEKLLQNAQSGNAEMEVDLNARVEEYGVLRIK